MTQTKTDGNFIREMFDRICGRYDLLNHVLSFGLDFWWRKQAVRALRPSANSRVLDLCCGTGDLSRALQRTGAQVTGLDFSGEMLRKAEAKYPQIRFIQGDACQVPLENGSFDAATMAFGPRNIPDLPRLWRELQRLVKPGGKIVTLELTRPNGPLKYLHRFYLNTVLPVVGQVLSGDAEAYRYLSCTVQQFVDPEGLKRSMESAGLKNVNVIPLTFGVATLHVAEVP